MFFPATWEELGAELSPGRPGWRAVAGGWDGPPRPGGERGGGRASRLEAGCGGSLFPRPLLPAGPASLAGRPGRAAGYL